MQPRTCVTHRLVFGGLLAGSLLLAGCATAGRNTTLVEPAGHAAQSIHLAQPPSIGEAAKPNLIPVTRYGRYTLVELVPEQTQRDLLQQVIEVSIPSSLDASVGDGLRHVLLRTGYRLCETPDTAALYALPLPAAHLRLGPLPLREALLALAGPVWDLSVDDATREVCFQRKAAAPPTSTRPAQSSPVQVGAAEAKVVQSKEDHP
jgi:type IV pili sensor histidine kinase/response regulator